MHAMLKTSMRLKRRKKLKRNRRLRTLIKLPQEYLQAIESANTLFPALYQFENGLRLLLHKFLSGCYGQDWWESSLKSRQSNIYKYVSEQQLRLNFMPWIGTYSKVDILPVHLVTLGQLEEIVKIYRSECIPELFPTIEFFLGHMEVIKRVRNMYSHMFPCITKSDTRLTKSEIRILAIHINSKLYS